mmetsp:Transcript_24713/g.55003  ORF Transcript_24713/g.55003 Transcript_24713/m.55003 type:complete len:303 (-) Transcript_24713:463-1371(-)
MHIALLCAVAIRRHDILLVAPVRHREGRPARRKAAGAPQSPARSAERRAAASQLRRLCRGGPSRAQGSLRERRLWRRRVYARDVRHRSLRSLAPHRACGRHPWRCSGHSTDSRWHCRRQPSSAVEPGRTHNVVQAWSRARVCLQNAPDEILGRVRDADRVWEGELIVTNPLVSGLHIRRLKGRLPDEHSVKDHTQGPDVHLVGVALLSLQNLRSNVVGRATDGALSLSVVLQLGCQPKVSHLQPRVSIEEEIAKFEVPVDHSLSSKILEGNDKVIDEEHRLWLSQPAIWPPFHEVVESLVGT